MEKRLYVTENSVYRLQTFFETTKLVRFNSAKKPTKRHIEIFFRYVRALGLEFIETHPCIANGEHHFVDKLEVELL